jgi:hypothetical protein
VYGGADSLTESVRLPHGPADLDDEDDQQDDDDE